jgi:hypothetical protein
MAEPGQRERGHAGVRLAVVEFDERVVVRVEDADHPQAVALQHRVEAADVAGIGQGVVDEIPNTVVHEPTVGAR